MRRLIAVLGQHAVPALLAGAFFFVQRLGVVRWMPVGPDIERDWGAYALLLGVISAVFASGWYDDREYGLVQFLVTVVIAVATTLSTMMAPFARELGLSPDLFSVLSRTSYVGFHVANGFLFGGAWTFVVRRLQAGDAREAY